MRFVFPFASPFFPSLIMIRKIFRIVFVYHTLHYVRAQSRNVQEVFRFSRLLLAQAERKERDLLSLRRSVEEATGCKMEKYIKQNLYELVSFNLMGLMIKIMRLAKLYKEGFVHKLQKKVVPMP